MVIFTDTEAIWKNYDTASHTVTSGSSQKGPNEIFDSSLILDGDAFTHKFESAGCLIAFVRYIHG